MPPRSWASLRKIKRHVDSDLPADRERLAIVRSQVADASDKDGWCYVFDYNERHYRYVHWHDAVDLLREHRASLVDQPTAVATEILP